MAPLNQPLDERLVTLRSSRDAQLLRAEREHKELSIEELQLWSCFFFNEGFTAISQFDELLDKMTCKSRLVHDAIQDIARRREAQRLANAARLNKLEQRILRIEKEIVPRAMEEGTKQLHYDAVDKMCVVLCGARTGNRNDTERAMALSVLYRYQDLFGRLRKPRDFPRTTTADKRRFAYYLRLAEREEVPRFGHLRYKLEVLDNSAQHSPRPSGASTERKDSVTASEGEDKAVVVTKKGPTIRFVLPQKPSQSSPEVDTGKSPKVSSPPRSREKNGKTSTSALTPSTETSLPLSMTTKETPDKNRQATKDSNVPKTATTPTVQGREQKKEGAKRAPGGRFQLKFAHSRQRKEQ
ncbi:hypothetical protein BDV96DRAFT_643680 [Lophiotrema nucula]|uniref:Uncharacterized protein n=1 Tax=Lophiotrema nucula TaxID=690887 RepID=A0A6A5ZH72_9PLEO|nr:hypothetical protein BDV96DRAFT_643680 [Lophiotrema nucula]